jgi:hypothetical protein
VRRSHTRGPIEKIAKKLGYKAFRCREAECTWRGLFRIKSPNQSTQGLLTKFRAPLILMGVMLISLTLFLFLINIDYLGAW